jgi:hypothetical protein
MLEPPRLDLRIVRGDELAERHRGALRPGAEIRDRTGIPRRLPEAFFEIPSWTAALSTQLTPNFGLWELIEVDVREAEPVRLFPRYVPCAVAILAGQLQLFREEVGRVVRIAANGAYRSPAHRLTRGASPHCWASAVNIYRIGDEWLDTREKVEKYAEIARQALPAVWTRPYGDGPGYALDHLHLDFGYLVLDPHGSRVTAPDNGGSNGDR